jgi:hypothetical protein
MNPGRTSSSLATLLAQIVSRAIGETPIDSGGSEMRVSQKFPATTEGLLFNLRAVGGTRDAEC